VPAATVLFIFVVANIRVILHSVVSVFARALPLIELLVLIRGITLLVPLDIVFVGRIGARISLGRLLLPLRLSIRHLPSPRGLIARKR
jgi:hypothetical protein